MAEKLLELAGRVTHEYTARESRLSNGYELLQTEGSSEHIILDDEQIKNLGVRLVAKTTVVAKEGYWLAKNKGVDKSIGRVVTDAAVEVGAIARNGHFQGDLVSVEPVLQVTNDNYTPVLYRYDEAPIAPVKPGTEAWDEMTALVDMLFAREAELRSKFIK